MGNVNMEARQIHYRGGNKPMSVEEAIKAAGNEIDSLKSGLTNVDVALNVPQYAGRNLLPMTLASIKAASTEGTWVDNVYTINGVTYTVNTDTNGNVTDIVANGTATENALLGLAQNVNLIEGTIINGSVGGSTSTGGYGIGLSDFGIVAPDGDKVITSTYAASARNVYIRVSKDGVVTNKTFTPMIRQSYITDTTYYPYIPSVESRIEGLAFSRIANNVTVTTTSASQSINSIAGCNMLLFAAKINSSVRNTLMVPYALFKSGVDVYIPITKQTDIGSLYVKYASDTSITLFSTIADYNYLDIYASS